MWTYLTSFFTSTKTLPVFETDSILVGKRAFQILVLFVIARIVIAVGCRMVKKFLRSRAFRMDGRRKATLESLSDNLIRYVVYFLFILTILPWLGIHIEALLAGAGIAGLAIGFGAQNLIKDILTGFFILFEDQYGVGDVVKINTFTGTVRTIGLRLTRIQAWTGEMEIIPNGQILQVTNYSRENSVAVMDVGVSYNANIEQASDIMKDILEGMKPEFPNMIGDISVLGIQALQSTNILLRATAICLPNSQYGVQRVAQLRIKLAFDAAGIEIPVQQTVINVQTDSHKNTTVEKSNK